MRKSVQAIIILMISLLVYPATAKAETITRINDLIENAKELDGEELTIQGEAIGESMDRGDYTWVNINDGSNAIGVWIIKSEAGKIKYYGDYKNIGDTLIISGVFYRACKEHGGEADFHATSLVIKDTGHPVKTLVPVIKMIAAFLLTAAALSLYLYFYKVKSRSALN